MAATNLLDRLAEDYEGLRPVEYRAALVKPLTDIVGVGSFTARSAATGGGIGPKIYQYKIGGGEKGQSARDIIRDRIQSDMYPLNVLENQKTKKRIDESKNYDFAIVDNSRPTFPGFELFSFDAENKTEAKKKFKQMKDDGLLDGWINPELVSNLKSNQKSYKQKRDLDAFKKAFDEVRQQRDFGKGGIDGDVLNTKDIRSKKALLDFESDKVKRHNDARINYGVNSWKEWLDAKMAAKAEGENLAKIFSKQNKREKAAYAEIQNTGNSFLKGDYVPVKDARPVRALGNQNHEYSHEPDYASSVENPISVLEKDSHKVRYVNGKPVVDMFTWTQIPNIEKIKKTGYLATVGADTENFHPGTTGMWTSDKDTFPMAHNFVNGVDIGTVGPNGETFNEELLHTRIPMSMYNNIPVLHQGKRGHATMVDIVKAKPNAPEVVIGEGDSRKFEKIAMRPEFIEHIPEDKLRADWSMTEGSSSTIPGWHPNKPWAGKTLDEALKDVLGEKDYNNYVYKGSGHSRGEKANYLLNLIKDKDNARRLLSKSTIDLKSLNDDRLYQRALGEYYYNADLEGKTPYEIVRIGNNPPAFAKGSIRRSDLAKNGNGTFWTDALEPSDLSRTKSFIVRNALDKEPLKEFRRPFGLMNPVKMMETSIPETDNAALGKTYIVRPNGNEMKESYNKYLQDAGLANFENVKNERAVFPKSYPSLLPPQPEKDRKLTEDRMRTWYKESLNNMKTARSAEAKEKLADKGFSNDDIRVIANNITYDNKYGNLSNFSFDDWFENYMRKDPFFKDYYDNPETGGDLLKNPGVQQSIAEERERVRPFVEAYLDNLKELPSDKDLAKKAYEDAKLRFKTPIMSPEEELKYAKSQHSNAVKADSLDKVIGHMIGRRIGKDRAKRGKKIF